MAIGYDEYGNQYEYDDGSGYGGDEGYAYDQGQGYGYGGGGGFFSVGEPGRGGDIDRFGNERVMRVPSVAHIGENKPSH